MSTCLVFILGLATIILLLIYPTSGLFDATLTSIKMMFQNDTTFMSSKGLRIKKVNRTHVMTGTIEFFVDVGNEYQMVSYFLKKTGDGYQRMPYKIGPFPFCQYLDDDKYFIEGLRKYSNFPPKGTCPWPKMKYLITNYEVNLDNIPPFLSSGDYMAESSYLKDGKMLNGIQFFAKIQHI